MKKSIYIIFLFAGVLGSFACATHGLLKSVNSIPKPTPASSAPTNTPGCYSANPFSSASGLPVTQYSFPNPAPVVTPLWTPVIGTPTMTISGYVDNGSHGAVILKTYSDWNGYWSHLGLAVPPPPTRFSNSMVFVPGTYNLYEVCFTATNLVIYQGNGSPGANLNSKVFKPVDLPARYQRNFYVIPISNLPVSFISTFVLGI